MVNEQTDEEQYIWNVNWQFEEDEIEARLVDGWEPFGFAVNSQGEGVVAFRKLMTRAMARRWWQECHDENAAAN